ncbi:hypothetical protein QL285_063942 [Trifolium repens]|nr:hypothetical protein QL285_063942 [Trifolium repens]
MDDSTDVPSSSSQPKSTRVRGSTMMAQITKVRQTGIKIVVEFDPRTHACIGDRKNAATFRSYVAFLARSKCSLLKDEWKDINSKIKDAIWIDIKGYFTIPQCEDPKKGRLKDEWIRYVGDRWRVEVVAEKIDSLVEETKKGVFVSDGRNDILTAAIGTSEHGGRVRGVGKHHKLSTFFGRSSSRQRHDHIDVQEELAQIRSDFDHKLAEERKAMQQTFMETLKSMGFSQPLETNNEVVQSCQKVVKKLLSMEAQKQVVLLQKEAQKRLNLMLFRNSKCIRELLMGFNWLDLSILQVWCTYIRRICVKKKSRKCMDLWTLLCCVIVIMWQKLNQLLKNT